MVICKQLIRPVQKCLIIAAIGLSLTSFVVFTAYAAYYNRDLDSQLNNKDFSGRKIHKAGSVISNVTMKIKAVAEKLKIITLNKTQNHWHIYRGKEKMISNVQNSHKAKALKNEGKTVNNDVNTNVHIFYYPWYKNEQFDGRYAHWNHELIPHWNNKIQVKRGKHVPPDDIGANFYPKLGPYSSSDPLIVEAHMKHIKFSGAGVLAVSWYPPNQEAGNETAVDDLMMKILDAADQFGLKIVFHIEPFKNRSGKLFAEVIQYIIKKYGNHTAFYRKNHKGRKLPLFYVYDSYQIDPKEWAEALKIEGHYTLRNSLYDGIFIGLLVEYNHLAHITNSGFDGFYTYFASNGFVYGSSWRNWPILANEAKNQGLIFVPSIGPGYLDTRVRPWNGQNTKLRLNGRYYKSAFKSALAVRPSFLTLTSFNEWHEGTQIEPAVPKAILDYQYENYLPYAPEFYLNLTRELVQEYTRNVTERED
ncbi:unnamed protein product [Lymnaea stagnalis]|uniref:Glycoprotein endo-alpha-1,2-mannosidase n=1 Tax=Lymnaea stagnalis TaxID=6523 RepID=A0AAV2IIG1_LYMST